ncbi:MAG: ComEA family DNA-binding protein [Candidatus Limnocylindrales bacterium]
MTETGFDWRRLAGSAPEVHAESQRSGPPMPIGRWLAIGGLVVIGVVMSMLLAVSTPTAEVTIDGGAEVGPAGTGDVTAAAVVAASAAVITVDVDGAVARPGLVTLPLGSRIGDAIMAAGGFAPTADARAASAINLAATLADGDQVTVPDRDAVTMAGAAAPSAPVGPAAPSSSDPIDLDRATMAELGTLPGIGPVTANKILAARDEAPFQRVDDLLTRELVGPATFEKIKALVTADGR